MGGTLVKSADTLKANGAASVAVIVTHGILSEVALERLNKSEALSRVVATNTVPFTPKKLQCQKVGHTLIPISKIDTQVIA